MKRFIKDDLVQYINEVTEKLNRKPRVVELMYHINSRLKSENFNSYESLCNNLVGENIVKHYVELYGLDDMMSITKKQNKKNNTEEQQ